MTEKSKGAPDSGDTGRSPTGPIPQTGAVGNVGSPMDQHVTQEFARPNLGKEVPRTDDELGLDPDDLPNAEARTEVLPTTAPQPPADDATYSYASIPPAANAPTDPDRLRRTRDDRRGTLDLGLFVLRLVVGVTFVYHGVQKAFGWFHGPGFDGTKDFLTQGGWDNAGLAAPLLIAGEIGGGLLLVLGLATPLAAGAVLAVILDALAFKQGMYPGFQYKAGPGAIELESILAGATVAVLLAGPGRWSLDRGRGWATRPSWGSLLILLLAIGAAALTWWYLHGGNPLAG
ncbi:DoxX family protein [Nocardia jiangsuensis]|uniref:DoxX family protein n=1 Tax=Nocardia jiangsuensis TaxID=1691563 RepID=A0ABV8DNK1_9NOCA